LERRVEKNSGNRGGRVSKGAAKTHQADLICSELQAYCGKISRAKWSIEVEMLTSGRKTILSKRAFLGSALKERKLQKEILRAFLSQSRVSRSSGEKNVFAPGVECPESLFWTRRRSKEEKKKCEKGKSTEPCWKGRSAGEAEMPGFNMGNKIILTNH